jgi:hypothetical protein
MPKKHNVPANEETTNFIFRKMVYTLIRPCAAIIFDTPSLDKNGQEKEFT